MTSVESLAGRTIFVSGGSRGIGMEIAMRCAADGANVALAAKTDKPHPRLPGTIHSAAEAVERAGGRALPLICDIRDADAVASAVRRCADAFGGIDAVVNNASAIQLTGTEETEIKRFDLMISVNMRGSFAVTRAAVPHLLRSTAPRILTIAPPLDFSAQWWNSHPPYTLAKYGMSLLAWGWASEFNGRIASNCLWPRTVIDTAAVRNLLGGEAMARRSRKPAIMADAGPLDLDEAPVLHGMVLPGRSGPGRGRGLGFRQIRRRFCGRAGERLLSCLPAHRNRARRTAPWDGAHRTFRGSQRREGAATVRLRCFDHPLRAQLTDELHARPFQPVSRPGQVFSIAFKPASAAAERDPARDLAHLEQLLSWYGVAPPAEGASHHASIIGAVRLKWERHTEFVSYTFYGAGSSDGPFSGSLAKLLPEGWIADAPGAVAAAVQCEIVETDSRDDALDLLVGDLGRYFDDGSRATGVILDGNAVAASDFRLHGDGFTRFAVIAFGDAGPRRLGRSCQRLIDIEVYRALAMLALPIAQSTARRLNEVERELTALMERVTAPEGTDSGGGCPDTADHTLG